MTTILTTLMSIVSSVDVQAPDIWYEGKCSSFHAKLNSSLYEATLRTHYSVPDGVRVRLPLISYCACRWNFRALRKHFNVPNNDFIKALLFMGYMVEVYNPENGIAVHVRPVDWGPSRMTGRAIDLDPGTLRLLKAKTDDVLKFRLYRRVEPEIIKDESRRKIWEENQRSGLNRSMMTLTQRRRRRLRNQWVLASNPCLE